MRGVWAAGLSALALLAAWAGVAQAHPAGPPIVPVKPPSDVQEIPPEDESLYRSRVTEITPPAPGLRAKIVDGQEKLQVSWEGEEPLVIFGPQGEPFIRLSAAGIDINERAPSAYLSSERYARVPLPLSADPSAPPRWRRLEAPGSISWFEHRAQWMTAERPTIVNDGSEAVTIFHWRVDASLAGRPVAIKGVLDWVPDPDTVREARSGDGDPLLAAGIVLGAMALGAGVGIGVRRRLPEPPTPGK